jgi:hypothetical protein
MFESDGHQRVRRAPIAHAADMKGHGTNIVGMSPRQIWLNFQTIH